jgi:hypothetical protein
MTNERFKQLERQATDYYSNGQERIFDRQKFAELIVQDLINSMIKRYGDDDELPIQEIKLFVKEHFGVEE